MATVNANLHDVQLFQADRGTEFKNQLIEELLTTFGIERSLSKKGCPYDNAVAEATYKIFKTEFVKRRSFTSFEELKAELADYIHWYNHIRIHGTLGYLSPVQYRLSDLEKGVFLS